MDMTLLSVDRVCKDDGEIKFWLLGEFEVEDLAGKKRFTAHVKGPSSVWTAFLDDLEETEEERPSSGPFLPGLPVSD